MFSILNPFDNNFVAVFLNGSNQLVEGWFFHLLIKENAIYFYYFKVTFYQTKEGANKRGNSSRLTQSFHFFMFEPIFSPVNALNQPI